MYTQEEAKAKLCHLNLINQEPGTYNRCHASECMAWRWNGQDLRFIDGADRWIKVGYCGLAGKP